MAGSKIILGATRAFQLLFAAVVLGTSVSMSKWLPNYQNECNALEKDKYCDQHGLIHAIQFGCFVGAVCLIDALAGIVSVFMETLVPFIVTLGLDAFAAISYLAGGLAISIILSKNYFDKWSGSRANEVKADAAFNFLGFLITLVIIGMVFMWQRSGKMHSAV